MTPETVRCVPCITGHHLNHPHTWLSALDAVTLNLGWPLSSDEAAARPCSCECAQIGVTA